MNELEIDTRGGHCQKFVASLVVLLCPTRMISESAVRWGLFYVHVLED